MIDKNRLEQKCSTWNITLTGTQLDLLDSQVNEQSAATEYLDAVKEMYLALVDLRSALGEYAVQYAHEAGSTTSIP